MLEPLVEKNLGSKAIPRLAAALSAMAAPLEIAKNSVLALDIGSASCGFALLQGERIVLSGVRLYAPAALNHKQQSRQQQRRQVRATRVRLLRHRQRRAAVRRLLIAAGLPDPLAEPARGDPYAARAAGLDRRLTPAEWSGVLYQIAKRRGGGSAGDGWPAVDRPCLRGLRTLGEMLARHPDFAARKRNCSGSHPAVFPASAYRDEVQALFAAQRQAGNPRADPGLEAAYSELTFALGDRAEGEARVGACPFLPERRRGAKHAPSIERYAYLDALTKLKIVDGADIRRLTAAELSIANARFGETPSVSFADLRAWFGWGQTVRPARDLREEADLVCPAGGAAGTVALRQVLRPASIPSAGLQDAVMAVLAFRQSPSRVRSGLRELGLPPDAVAALSDAHARGAFGGLRGAAPLSAAAAVAMTPYLAVGNLFHDAAIAAGLDPLARENAILDTVRNPCVIRAVLEALRQVQAVIRTHGFRPERIHVETADDLACSGPRRARLAVERGKAARRWEAAKVALAGMMPASRIRSRDVERYLLWEEQRGRCIYSGAPISSRQLLDGWSVQVDHILPRIRSGDNSRQNRVLCLARENQDKGERTPFEWRGSDAAWWAAFQRRIEGSQLSGPKRHNLLTRHFAEREGRILQRNLNDTHYAARCVLAALRGLYAGGQVQRHLFARPGRVTATLRRAWDFTKDRDDPRHHALDAIVLAAAGPKTMKALTHSFRNAGSARDTAIPLPWSGFGADVERALSGIVPSRSETRRGRGQAHGMTVRRARPTPSGSVRLYERRPVWKLRLADLERIPDPEANAPTIRCLRNWIEAGRPQDRLPVSPSGAPIRRVRLLVSGSTGIPREGLPVRGGMAAFGEIVRLDLYRRDGRYHPVPVHRSDIASLERPPSKAIAPGALRADWQELGGPEGFCFSIYHGSYVEISPRRGAVKAGFVRSFDCYKSQLVIAPPHSLDGTFKVGIGTALQIRKYDVDRLGRLTPVRGEALTWRGRTIAPCGHPGDAEEKTSLREVA